MHQGGEFMIAIEKGVPITDQRGVGKSTGRPAKYPWAAMEIGDSFKAEVAPDALRASASGYGKRNGARFIVRKDGSGSRAWRVE